jgi:hypothetical protein
MGEYLGFLGQPLQVLGFDESLAYGKDVLQIHDYSL